MALESTLHLERLDGHRRRAVVSSSCRPTGGTNTRDNVAAPPTAVVDRLLQPAPLRRLLQRRSADPVGQHRGRLAPTAISAPWAKAAWAAPARASRSLSNYTVTLYNYNPVTQTSSVVVAGGSGNRLVLQLDPGQHALGRRLPGLHPQPGRARRHRHPDLRHLRQPARRREPRQPDRRQPAPTSRRCPITRTCSPTAPIARTT